MRLFILLLGIISLFSCGTSKFVKEPKVFFQTNSKIRSAILIDNGRLYYGNDDCEFYAINIFTQKEEWIYSTDAAVETWPVITDGKIIFNAENSLYILDCINGNEIYKVTQPSKNKIRVSQDRWAFNDSYVAVSNGIAYYLTLDGELVAVDINKGSIIWTLISESPGVVASGINYDNGKLYYVDNSGHMCCVDIDKRKINFRTYIGDQIYARIYINNGKLYAGGRSAKMYCIDGNSGEIIWSSHSFDKTTWLSGGSVSIGDTLYTCTSDEHTLAAFNKVNGEFLRIYPTETNAYTKPVLNSENIIVAATDVYTFTQSNIMEFDTKNHCKLWQIKLDDCVLSSPAIYQEVLYFGSDSGRIYYIALSGNKKVGKNDKNCDVCGIKFELNS